MNLRQKLSAWADLLFRREVDHGFIDRPLTVSEAGRLGAAVSHSNYRARVAAKADQLAAENAVSIPPRLPRPSEHQPQRA